jgi:hypothetical protein
LIFQQVDLAFIGNGGQYGDFDQLELIGGGGGGGGVELSIFET